MNKLLSNSCLIISRKTCSTIILTDYEKFPRRIWEEISLRSFVVNTTSHYPDLVCVLPNEFVPTIRAELMTICSYVDSKKYEEV